MASQSFESILAIANQKRVESDLRLQELEQEREQVIDHLLFAKQPEEQVISPDMYHA